MNQSAEVLSVEVIARDVVVQDRYVMLTVLYGGTVASSFVR
jgi:hypothetical protein